MAKSLYQNWLAPCHVKWLGWLLWWCLRRNLRATWLLAVATVAVGVACIYNPAVGAYIAKIISSIPSTAHAAAAALIPIFPHIIKAVA